MPQLPVVFILLMVHSISTMWVSNKNSSSTSATKQGFTIVELLIVVVIIAILAAITIISFRGVQERAHIAATSTNIKTYVNGLEMMKTIQGGYFKGDGALGITGESTGSTTYTGERCAEYGYTPGTVEAPAGAATSAFNQALLPYLGSIPKQAMSTKVTTLVSSADGCSVTIKSGAPYYIGVKKIVIQNNDLTYTFYSSAENAIVTTAAAFDITYFLSGDSACFIGNHFKKYYAANGYTECHTLGGDVTR